MEVLSPTPSKQPQRRWLRIALWALGGVVALCVAFAGYLVHYVRAFDLQKTFIYMELARPPFFRFFRYNLYALHPTPDEVLKLNREAGASIVLDMKDKVEQERLLSHLIAAGMDINAQDEKTSLTVLHMAASGSPKDVALLLAHGARADVKNVRGRTPLDLALRSQKRFPSPEGAQAIQLLQAAQQRQ